MKKKFFILGVFLLISVVVWNWAQYKKFPMQKGVYLGQRPPGATAEVFAPGIFSFIQGEYGIAFSPDGKDCFFSVKESSGRESMQFMSGQGSFWTPPQNAPFVSRFNDCDPFFSSDGQRLYFISTRPDKGRAEKDWDIWYVKRTKRGWSEAINIGSPVNSAMNEYYVSITKDGTIYFASNRTSGSGSYDIYRCRLEDGRYTRVVNLGDAINSKHMEHDPFIAPDESYLIFTSGERSDGFGEGDLYISFRGKDGTWNEAKNLGKAFNTSGYDFCPMVSPNGKYFFFARNGEIYWVRIETILSLNQ